MSASMPRGTRMAARLVHRAHVASLHQGIVLDAVSALEMPESVQWQRLFLHHAGMLALGAAAPDDEFRDFRNHVMSPTGTPWRGAAARAESWYQNLVSALRKREWENAAYCTGVLAHYVIDALHPLHTAQSAAENDIHFACDVASWSLWPSLRVLAAAARPTAVVTLVDAPDFLSQALVTGAEHAHHHYAALCTHVDLVAAPDDPAAALDATAQKILVKVIAAQQATVAAVVARAIREAGVGAPQVALTATCIRAFFGWSINSVAKLRRQRCARATLALMRDEVRRTGHASASLPDEERAKRDLFANDLQGAAAGASGTNVVLFGTKPQDGNGRPVGDDEMAGEVIVLQRRRMAQESPRPAPRRVEAGPLRRRREGVGDALAEVAVNEAPHAAPAVTVKLAAAAAVPRSATSHDAVGLAHAAAASLLMFDAAGVPGFRDRRAAAPMPDTGQAASLGRAFEEIAGLTNAQSDLLRGAGYKDLEAIADAVPEQLCADLLAFATTPDGIACLKAGAPPDIEMIRDWVGKARDAKAA
jgi:hypothetical protein